jgi:hypothetical protein
MQKILPGAEVEELKEKTLSLRLQLFKERISGASAANIARMATAAMGLSSMEGAHAKPMMYGTVEVTWSDAYQIPIMNVTPIEDQNFAEEFSELQLPTAIVTMIMLTIFTAITAALIFQAIQSRSKRIKLGSKDADTHEATCLLIGFGFPAILFFTLVEPAGAAMIHTRELAPAMYGSRFSPQEWNSMLAHHNEWHSALVQQSTHATV